MQGGSWVGRITRAAATDFAIKDWQARYYDRANGRCGEVQVSVLLVGGAMCGS